ncbi:ribonuclease III [Candidatus Viridilinea mediisalina]|uniref:Ribonuclease 3 n=1 Tax=Candidatus Viridilinea mediisalina TaxID=2024553 RepID=A0A2A6RGB5_9CHLR|nr:ribonuclease III [Candidatus Viridilinea mediisalina]PDW01983.1 ribonuclease III [Candidatus Viridilinea mediisalina]
MSKRLEALIGVAFDDGTLLESAFVHRSFKHEHPQLIPGLSSNERLEFLGDSILNFITAAWLYTRYPECSEGGLTALRSALVRTTTLATFARELDLGAYVRIAGGEDNAATRNRDALLADLFEAVVGAIYLDQGLETAQAFVMPFLERHIEQVRSSVGQSNYRTRLQEVAQARFGHTPQYNEIAKHGPPHQLEFTMEVLVGDTVWGQGKGPNKQAASAAAAHMALLRIEAMEDS